MLFYDPENPTRGAVAVPQGTMTTEISEADFRALIESLAPEPEPTPDPQLLWALIISPDHGLPIYQELLQANQAVPIAVMTGTLTGTWSNSNLTLEDKVGATAGAIAILKATLMAMESWTTEKAALVQGMLTAAHFDFDVSEL